MALYNYADGVHAKTISIYINKYAYIYINKALFVKIIPECNAKYKLLLYFQNIIKTFFYQFNFQIVAMRFIFDYFYEDFYKSV